MAILCGWSNAVAALTVCYAIAAVGADGTASPAVRTAVADGNIGPYAAADFRLVQGACNDCSVPHQALWYFEDDFVAVPKAQVGAAGYARGVPAQQDVRSWFAQATPEDLQARSPLVWIGSPDVTGDAALVADDALRLRDGSSMRLQLTPKIATNRSYYDASSAAFFRERPLRLRGRLATGADGKPAFVARTIWPQDYSIDASKVKLAPLAPGESLASLVRQTDAAAARYETRLLWERSPGRPRDWGALAAFGVMLNAAQGDDDEAHGGHFAIVTGRNNARGDWSEWLVNNFYNLDSFSEKGIIAAMVPMDNYLMDLNSGQSYYRPSYMLVALLRGDRVSYGYQGAVSRVYQHFYRHDFRYRHTSVNCAGISLDTLRSLGWNIPQRGPTSYAKALAAYPYMAIKEMSVDSGRKSFEYLSEEQTRLYPAVAFEAAATDLLQLAGARAAAGSYEQWLKEDVEALLFVRIPQIPSSRAPGTFPVASVDEYMQRAPQDRAQWKIVPVEPRPFPQEFRDEYTEPAEPASHEFALMAGLALVGGALTVRAVRRRRAGRR